jgi:hypothetical protein
MAHDDVFTEAEAASAVASFARVGKVRDLLQAVAPQMEAQYETLAGVLGWWIARHFPADVRDAGGTENARRDMLADIGDGAIEIARRVADGVGGYRLDQGRKLAEAAAAVGSKVSSRLAARNSDPVVMAWEAAHFPHVIREFMLHLAVHVGGSPPPHLMLIGSGGELRAFFFGVEDDETYGVQLLCECAPNQDVALPAILAGIWPDGRMVSARIVPDGEGVRLIRTFGGQSSSEQPPSPWKV